MSQKLTLTGSFDVPQRYWSHIVHQQSMSNAVSPGQYYLREQWSKGAVEQSVSQAPEKWYKTSFTPHPAPDPKNPKSKIQNPKSPAHSSQLEDGKAE